MERWALRWARAVRSANHPSLFIRADVRPARNFSSWFGVTGGKAKEGSQLQKNPSLAHRRGKSGALGRSTHYRLPLHNPKEQRHHILPFAGKPWSPIGRDGEQGDQEEPMALYISVEEALGMSGLRVVLTPSGPAPWCEALKAILHVKRLSYIGVRQEAPGPNLALREWTAQTSAPVAIWNDERPRSTWIEQLYLAERLAPEPALIPADIGIAC